MPEAPELEVLLKVDQLFAAFVFLPVLLRVLVDDPEGLQQLLVEGVGDAEVAIEQPGGHRESASGQAGEELVVDARLVEILLEPVTGLGLTVEDGKHRPVLVAQQELHGPVLPGLEPRSPSQMVAEPDVLTGGQRGQHRPLLGQGLLDVLDACDAFERGLQLVLSDESSGVEEFMDDEPEPQLRGLMLDDEQHLVVVLGPADGVLGTEQPVEVEVGPVGHGLFEVRVDLLFEIAFVLLRSRSVLGHGLQPKGMRRRHRRASGPPTGFIRARGGVFALRDCAGHRRRVASIPAAFAPHRSGPCRTGSR